MKIFQCFLLILFISESYSQDTFSIVAVDPGTQEVGSAGASCINGSIIISDVHPGIGAVHTQSYWNSTNQNNASDLMDQGYTPEEIIEYLAENDAQGNPSIRQYGVVDLVTREEALHSPVRIAMTIRIISLGQPILFRAIYYWAKKL